MRSIPLFKNLHVEGRLEWTYFSFYMVYLPPDTRRAYMIFSLALGYTKAFARLTGHEFVAHIGGFTYVKGLEPHGLTYRYYFPESDGHPQENI